MAVRGIGFFDAKGSYFRTPDEATLSDLSSLLGKIGEGDSLAPGIAKILLQRRREIEHIFADHDRMMTAAGNPSEVSAVPRISPVLVADKDARLGDVTPISDARKA